MNALWTISYEYNGKCELIDFSDYQQAYDYALSLCYLMFSHEFCTKFIKYHFDKNSSFRLGWDAVSLF